MRQERNSRASQRLVRRAMLLNAMLLAVMAARQSARAQDSALSLPKNITGTVFTPDGRPAAGARVLVRARLWRGPTIDQSSSATQVIAQGTCDDAGRFLLDAFKPSPASWQLAQILVVANGCGLAW